MNNFLSNVEVKISIAEALSQLREFNLFYANIMLTPSKIPANKAESAFEMPWFVILLSS